MNMTLVSDPALRGIGEKIAVGDRLSGSDALTLF